MPDNPDCACPNCASVLLRDDVLESHERLLRAFVKDLNAMQLPVADAMIVAASLAAWMADNIYANTVEAQEDSPEAQDGFTQSFVGIVEELLEQRIGMGDDDEEFPAAADHEASAPAEPVYVETYGGDPDTRH